MEDGGGRNIAKENENIAYFNDLNLFIYLFFICTQEGLLHPTCAHTHTHTHKPETVCFYEKSAVYLNDKSAILWFIFLMFF